MWPQVPAPGLCQSPWLPDHLLDGCLTSSSFGSIWLTVVAVWVISSWADFHWITRGSSPQSFRTWLSTDKSPVKCVKTSSFWLLRVCLLPLLPTSYPGFSLEWLWRFFFKKCYLECEFFGVNKEAANGGSGDNLALLQIGCRFLSNSRQPMNCGPKKSRSHPPPPKKKQ